jgi:hypothetical protein
VRHSKLLLSCQQCVHALNGCYTTPSSTMHRQLHCDMKTCHVTPDTMLAQAKSPAHTLGLSNCRIMCPSRTQTLQRHTVALCGAATRLVVRPAVLATMLHTAEIISTSDQSSIAYANQSWCHTTAALQSLRKWHTRHNSLHSYKKHGMHARTHARQHIQPATKHEPASSTHAEMYTQDCLS